jgi:hypothetical protein
VALDMGLDLECRDMSSKLYGGRNDYLVSDYTEGVYMDSLIFTGKRSGNF